MITFDNGAAPTMEQHRAMKDAARAAFIAKQTAKGAPKLADPRPPIEPPTDAPTALPRAHDVVRWHHDGRVVKTRHKTKEQAFEYAETSHYATVYKWMVLDGREIIARRLVSEPMECDQ